MTTQELHIQIDVLFNKINSHYNQNITPSEKDLLLNREQVRFVNKLINPLNSVKGQAAFDVVKKTTELAPLVATYEAPLVIDVNKKEASFLLPFNCLYPITARLSACPTCTSKPLVSHTIYELELKPINTRNDLPIRILQKGEIYTIQPGDIPDNYLIPTNTFGYANNYLINQAVMVILAKCPFDIEFTFDNSKNVIIARSTTSFTIENQTANATVVNKYEPFETDLYANVRFEDEEFTFNANNSFLSATKHKSVIANIRNKELHFYLPKGIIYGMCRLVYIKKPNKIDLYLKSNSDLTETGLMEVVSNLGQTLHGIIGTDNYEKYVRENTLIE